MRKRAAIIALILTAGASWAFGSGGPVWPPAPDPARVAWCDEIRCDDLRIASGLLGRVSRFLSGKSPDEKIALPFDVLVAGRTLYMTCQNLAAVVEVDLEDRSYRLIDGGKTPFQYPVALAGDASALFITDSDAGTVFRLADGKVEPFLTDGLVRPTGIAAIPERRLLFIVDTGDHTTKVFDYDGTLLQTIGRQAEGDDGFNYPTFAATDGSGSVLINDALNYRIKRYDASGQLAGAFGQEGDGPGTFSRPKGIAVDSRNHVYVVDNLFDNVQVFDPDGRILLVIGGNGSGAGEFWSPGGIDIVNDTIYIADTFNNRIQILRYLGDTE